MLIAFFNKKTKSFPKDNFIHKFTNEPLHVLAILQRHENDCHDQHDIDN